MGRSRSRHRSKSSHRSGSSTSSYDSRSRRHTKKHRTRRKDLSKKCKVSTSNDLLYSKVKLKSITDKVMVMVNEDKQRSRSSQNKTSETNTSCGCPYNCGPEIEKMRDYIHVASADLPSLKDNKLPVQLSKLVPNLDQLLKETWESVGYSKLADLVPPDLVEICSRRERRDARHPPGRIDTDFGKPPFDFLSPTEPYSGVQELWRRCMFELRDCSTEEIQHIMSGQMIFDRAKFMERSAEEEEELPDPALPIADEEKNRLQPADSTMADEDKSDQPIIGSSSSSSNSRMSNQSPRVEHPNRNPNQAPSHLSTVSSSVPDTDKSTDIVSPRSHLKRRSRPKRNNGIGTTRKSNPVHAEVR